MTTNKSISPAEFRLHNKIFAMDFSPSNYFEKLRFEMVLQHLVFWFWRYYGLYFYVQRLKIMDEKIRLQVYFYKTYLYRRFIKTIIKAKIPRGIDSIEKGWNPNKAGRFTFKWLHFYNPELFTLFLKIKSLRKYRQSKGVSGTKTFKSPRFAKTFGRAPLLLVKPNVGKRSRSHVTFTHFFTYFFLYFFKLPSVILSKSLYKAMALQNSFKVEQRTLLYKTRYIRHHRWSFDFLFLAHFALTFSNTSFLLPFYFAHVVRKYTQVKYAILLFNVLRKLYLLKRNIRAIKLLVNGTYNRHGRTHFKIFKIGDLAFSYPHSCVMYDAIQWLTPYGAVSLKMWVYYSE